jgi:predicted RecB family nuclease
VSHSQFDKLFLRPHVFALSANGKKKTPGLGPGRIYRLCCARALEQNKAPGAHQVAVHGFTLQKHGAPRCCSDNLQDVAGENTKLRIAGFLFLLSNTK